MTEDIAGRSQGEQDEKDADRLAEAHGETDFAGFPEAGDGDAGDRSAVEDAALEAGGMPEEQSVDPSREQPR
ncbi:hypothetical protein [Microbacterium album]|uniref:Uncharacterized protein n=1 Tax=Microbacterium album TaxID=2053191 RepID=A0A917IGE4_9MICO|nr:hypothetical protein [Microbacterium album]GGH47892.1 hypothetical protein GCM10010921_24970 [Microbacterium album]